MEDQVIVFLTGFILTLLRTLFAALVPIAAAAPDGRVASFEYRKTDFDDIRLTVTHARADGPDLPPGTVMVSTGPPPEDEAAMLPLGFAGF